MNHIAILKSLFMVLCYACLALSFASKKKSINIALSVCALVSGIISLMITIFA